DDLTLLAMCEWWLGDLPAAVRRAEDAFRLQGAAGRRQAAARGALDLALISYSAGDPGLGSAWFARARRVLAGQERSVAGGYLLYASAIARLEAGDELAAAAREDAAAGAARLSALADELGDPVLHTLAQVVFGCAAVLHGRVGHGFDLLDEAMLAAVAGDLPALWAGDVYCSVLHL